MKPLIVLLACLNLVLPVITFAEPEAYQPNLYELTNRYRLEKDLNTLTPDQELVKSAQVKCDHMQAHNYYAHDWKDQKWHTFLPKRPVVGENLAKNYENDYAATEGWKGSPTHDANLKLPLFKRVGFASCSGPAGNLIVQHLSS